MTALMRKFTRRLRPSLGAALALCEWRRMYSFEPAACLGFDRVVTTSELERRLLLRLCRRFLARRGGGAAALVAKRDGLGARVTVVPQSVDCDYFRPAPDRIRRLNIAFWGRLTYPPNEDAVRYFAREILPLVRRSVPDARFVVVGSQPRRSLCAMAHRGEITLHPSVPDIRPFVQEADVAVAPMRVAVGVQSKVLEAMASGIPVVCTPGARQGIDAKHGEHVLVGPNAEVFAQHVARLLLDRDFAARIARSARERVEQAHSWEVAAARLEAVYAEAICAHAGFTPMR
jgi:glycosyltransferase involved in cell wall biosynthesis